MHERSERRRGDEASTVEEAIGLGGAENSAGWRKRQHFENATTQVAFVQYGPTGVAYPSDMLHAYEISAGVFVRGLTQLKTILSKGEAHGAKVTACLVDGMQDLAAQVHWASEGSKLALDRVLGVSSAPAPAPSSATTYASLHEAIDGAIGALEAIDQAALEASLDRTVDLPLPRGTRTYRGDRFLIEFALPNFFFHLTLAYAILRKEGVPLEKGDFMGR